MSSDEQILIDLNLKFKKWVPLESNFEIFTQYAHSLGMPKHLQFAEVFSLDPEMWSFIPQPILALIFLYEIKDVHKEAIY